MKNYMILIKESNKINMGVVADSFDDACCQIEDQINNGKLFLEPELYERHYENAISKELPSDFSLKSEYNNNILKFTVNNEIIEFSNIHTVRDLKHAFESMCICNLEDNDLIEEREEENINDNNLCEYENEL